MYLLRIDKRSRVFEFWHLAFLVRVWARAVEGGEQAGSSGHGVLAGCRYC